MIEMLVADNQRLDLALPQHLVDALLGETPIHPGRDSSRCRTAGGARAPSVASASSSAEKAGGVVRVQQRRTVARDRVLIGFRATGVLDVAEYGGGIEPAGFGDAANRQPSQTPISSV